MSYTGVREAIDIRLASPRDADTLALVEELDAYLTGLYPPDANYLFSIDELCQPNVSFYAAYVDGKAVACGAVVAYPEYVEVKRVFVRPDRRGRGLAQAIIACLEVRALELGYSSLRLETGTAQPDAITLYERCGFQRRGPFGGYPDIPLSVFMEKGLVAIC
jgi:putative acetyltransferase